MLTIEYRVNNTLVGQIYAHNKGYIDAAFDSCTYDWHCYSMSGGKGHVVKGKVIHSRKEGFEKLASILFQAVEDELDGLE